MEDRKTELIPEKTGKKKRKWAWLAIPVVLVIVLAGFWAIGQGQKEPAEKVDFSDVEKICELATLRCYYHNVISEEKQPDGLFRYGLFRYGYKKYWMEYDGIVEVGINASDVQIQNEDTDGVVRIYVPDAQILNVDADESSMGDPIVETGLFTKITSEEKADAYAKAQQAMRKNAESDENILSQAKNNAKKLLERYVIQVTELTDGRTCTVEWLEEPAEADGEEGEA